MSELKEIYNHLQKLSMFHSEHKGNKVTFSSSKVGLYIQGVVTLSDGTLRLHLEENHLLEESDHNYYPDRSKLEDLLSGLDRAVSDYSNAVSDLSTLFLL